MGCRRRRSESIQPYAIRSRTMDAGPAVRRNQVRGLRGQAPRRVLPLAHRTDQLQRKEQPVGKRPRRRSAPSRASRKKIWLEVWRVPVSLGSPAAQLQQLRSDYSIKSSPGENGRGDVVHGVEQAARKYGLKFGVYLSPWDRHEPSYSNSAEYDKYYSAELDELAQGYGNLQEFWLDGAGSAGHVYNFPRIIEELRTYQPNTLVFADVALFDYGDIRWVGNEDGVIPYENWNVIDRHGFLRWRPVEADTPLRKGHWFWHPNDESSLKSLPELVSTYEQTVGRGGQLMLGIAPDRRGLLPEADVQMLKELGAALRQRYGNNLVAHHLKTIPELELALDGNLDTFWSAPAGSHHAVLEVNFATPITFNHALTMEWLNAGQRVEKYAIEIYRGGKWIQVFKGNAVGHKRIDHFAPVTASRLRLNILSSSAEAHIREFQLFDSKDGSP